MILRPTIEVKITRFYGDGGHETQWKATVSTHLPGKVTILVPGVEGAIVFDWDELSAALEAVKAVGRVRDRLAKEPT